MIIIRQETSKDYSQVFQVNSLAFEKNAEAELVEKLRDIQPNISIVAEIDGKIVGHIFFSPMFLAEEKTNFLGLAPMAVLPAFQKQGIGSKLLNEGLRIACDQGFTAVFVLGHAKYYPRFGFEIAKTRGFTSEYKVPDEHFMVLELIAGSLSGRDGLITYCSAFAEL